jgi:hypothetical protein
VSINAFVKEREGFCLKYVLKNLEIIFKKKLQLTLSINALYALIIFSQSSLFKRSSSTRNKRFMGHIPHLSNIGQAVLYRILPIVTSIMTAPYPRGHDLDS